MSQQEIKKALSKVGHKQKSNSKQLLIDLNKLPHLWRWLERQSAVCECSKTSYVKMLIQLDLDKRGKE